MTLKILTFLSLLISLGEPQKSRDQEYITKERLWNFGPTTVHSINGKFYEEREIKNLPKPKMIMENLPKLKPSADNLNTDLDNDRKMYVPENVMTNASSLETERTLKPIEDLLNTVQNKHDEENDFNTPNNIKPNNIARVSVLKEKPINFYNERLVADIQNNGTVQTIRKELSFDSLLIKNDFVNNDMYEGSDNLIKKYVSNENKPEEDLESSKNMVPIDDTETRRIFPKVYYQHIPPEAIKTPVMIDNNFLTTSRNYKPAENKPVIQNNNNIEDKITSCDDESSQTEEERSVKDIVSKEPTKGIGISKLAKPEIMLMNHPRVCYACNSITDPTCWSPERNTAVKYCRGDHPSCFTKLYQYKGLSYTIRDCGKVCDRTLEDDPKYTYCTICHHDLCNSAHFVNIQKIIIAAVLLLSFSLT